MKLSKITLSVVAVIGVVAVGGSWYTGKQVEEKYQELVTQANHQFKQLSGELGANIAFKDVQIERHFFSSEAKYRLEVDLGDGEKLDFIGNDKIHHGPLPLNRLAKFNFLPVMMSTESKLQAPTQFKKFVGENIGSGVANISYSGDIKGNFEVSPIKYGDEAGFVEATPIKLEYSYQNAKAIDGTVELDAFKVMDKELDFQVQGVSYEMQAEVNGDYPNLTFGVGSAKVKDIEFKSKSGKLSQIKDIVVKGDNLLKGERLVSTGSLTAESFNLEGVEMGKLKMDMAYDLDAKLTNDITPLLSNPEAIENQQTTELLLKLLEKSAKFHINNFSFENSKGKVDLALILNMAQVNLQDLGNIQEVLKALSTSKFTSNINREYAEDLIRQISMATEKLSEEEAKAFAKQQVDAIFLNADVGHYGLRKVDENNVKMELSVENEKLIVNGRELTEDEIQMALFMIMMGASSLGQ
ncbi:YdgA family protein [Mannheimia pernigra]|uniref:YdgA family protein n=1 Tax=Mannheimia pernigra TaxID=111844 RepID=A0A7D5HUG7_9PAST|nr:DUF945 family protein [Mannheimia pernigra]QLB40856.1 YdgA family protein [Mannheimia pernigra]